VSLQQACMNCFESCGIIGRQSVITRRVPGGPRDNNICERALKRAILHRKNALFHKTCRGAHVGDLFMCLIHTCQLCGAGPFDYLTELERHAGELSESPDRWMPWNFTATLAAASASPVTS
jgi:transposase